MIELGRRLNAAPEVTRALLFLGFFVALSGLGVRVWPVAVVGMGWTVGLLVSQAAAGIADGRADADRKMEAALHPWIREGRAAWRELPANARADAGQVVGSLERYVAASTCAPHDETLIEAARSRRDALLELRDAYRSLRAHEIVGPDDDTDVVIARLMAAKVRELAAQLDDL